MVTSMLLSRITCFFLLFIAGKHESAPIIPKSSTNFSSTPLSAMNFMKKFGYLASGTIDSEALYKESAIINAVKDLQKFGNISVTGQLDNATLELMKSPRCGVPDIIRNENHRMKRYIIGSEGWRKRDITYFIANWSPKLGEEPVADELERAFDAWSGYSRLNFRPINNPSADIIIAFGRGPHGDDYPFDGPGNILAHAFFPYETGSYGGDVHFDDEENWTIRPPDPYEGTDFFTVAVHELGHSLGLSHSPVPSSIMFPYYKGYSPSFQLDYDDILAMYYLYRCINCRGISDNRRPQFVAVKLIWQENRYWKKCRSTTLTNTQRGKEVSQPLAEDESAGNINFNETREYTTQPSTTTDNNDVEEKEATDGETLIPSVSTCTTENSQGITFVGDYETVDEHRAHERNGSNINEKNKDDIPDICEGNYDSLSVFRDELFIFKKQYVWRFGTRGNILSGYPVNFHQLFPGIPENVTLIDASYERGTDGSIVFFTGNVFWVYDGNTFVENSPRPLTDYGISADVEKIDAAQVWAKNGKTYLYSKDKFWRFDEWSRTLDPGYPMSMHRWRGVPFNIDAAMTWTDGNTYFFKDTRFWRFDNILIKIDGRYPLVASEFWLSC